MYRKIVFIAVYVFFLLNGCKGCSRLPQGKSNFVDSENQELITHHIPDSVSISQFLAKYPLYSVWRNVVLDFYSQRSNNYVWYDTIGLNERAYGLMNLLSSEGEHLYLDSIIYHNRLDSLYYSCYQQKCSYDSWDARKLELELLLTINFFEYASKKWKGISDEDFKKTGWLISRKQLDYKELLEQNLKDKFDKCLANEPMFFQYNLLKIELQKMKRISESDAWPNFPDSFPNLNLNESDSLLFLVRKALHLLGDLTAQNESLLFDEHLQGAIKKYQLRHGLFASGLMDKETFESLKTPIAERVKTLLINMERCRWVPKIPEPNFIIINIPEYKLHVHTNRSLDWSCNIVVGKGSTETVIFNHRIESVVFSPYWVVPHSIITNEMLPQIKKNIRYLANHDLQVVNFKGEVINPYKLNWSKFHGDYFPYMIRQRPGSKNSLGLVKFLFPNKYDIYLHDTPTKSLFEQQDRAFSHGCIRIQEPFKMAKYLLSDQVMYTDEKINELMNGGVETKVMLTQTIPIMITYFTAWVDGEGKLQLRKDVYGHDNRMADILFKNN